MKIDGKREDICKESSFLFSSYFQSLGNYFSFLIQTNNIKSLKGEEIIFKENILHQIKHSYTLLWETPRPSSFSSFLGQNQIPITLL